MSQPRARLQQARITPAAVLARFGFYAALLILIAVSAAVSPAFLTLQNWINILQQTSTIGIMAIGETLVILAGGIDVSVGSILGLGGMIVLGTLSGLAVGLINGVLITWLGIDPFITTLAMLSVIRGVVYIVSNQYNVNIADNSDFLVLGRGHLGVIPISVLIFAALFVLA